MVLPKPRHVEHGRVLEAAARPQLRPQLGARRVEHIRGLRRPPTAAVTASTGMATWRAAARSPPCVMRISAAAPQRKRQFESSIERSLPRYQFCVMFSVETTSASDAAEHAASVAREEEERAESGSDEQDEEVSEDDSDPGSDAGEVVPHAE